jgi:hypothetical protein
MDDSVERITAEMAKFRLRAADLSQPGTTQAVLDILLLEPRKASTEIAIYYQVVRAMCELYKTSVSDKAAHIFEVIIAPHLSIMPGTIITHRLHGALSCIPQDALKNIIRGADKATLAALIVTPLSKTDPTRVAILRASTEINNLRISTTIRTEKNILSRAAADADDTYNKAVAQLAEVRLTTESSSMDVQNAIGLVVVAKQTKDAADARFAASSEFLAKALAAGQAAFNNLEDTADA